MDAIETPSMQETVMFGINLPKIDLTQLEKIWKPLEPVSDAIETARDVAIDVGMGVADMTYGAARDLAHGDIGEACASVERGYDRAVFQSCERFDYGVLYAAQHSVDVAAGALGPLGKPIQAVADRAFDIGFTEINTSYAIFREGARLPADMVTGLVGDVEHSVELAANGKWGAAAGQLAMAGVNVATAPAASMADMGVVALQGAASVAETALFLEPAGRPLTDKEIKTLKATYGNSIDYGLVRVKPGGVLNNAIFAHAGHTIGNTVYLTKDFLNPNGTLNQTGLDQALVHEVGHVWQYQNGGLDYIHRALGAQATLGTGGAGGAYLWQAELAKGKTFSTMNPEAQAEAINDLALALRDGTIDASDIALKTGMNLSTADVAFLTALAGELGWGTGAG